MAAAGLLLARVGLLAMAGQQECIRTVRDAQRLPGAKPHMLVEVPIEDVRHTFMDFLSIAKPIGASMHKCMQIFGAQLVFPR